MSVDIKKTVQGSLPKIPFGEMARVVLGETYTLSVVVCGDKLAQRINTEYRNKTYYPNVLSFPLSKTEGEIFLNIRKASREARQLETTTTKRAALLFVHGLFHLRGMDHSDRMEREEQRILQKFNLA